MSNKKNQKKAPVVPSVDVEQPTIEHVSTDYDFANEDTTREEEAAVAEGEAEDGGGVVIIAPEDGVEDTASLKVLGGGGRALTDEEERLAGVLRVGQGLFVQAINGSNQYRICNLLKITATAKNETVSLRGYGDGWVLLKKK